VTSVTFDEQSNGCRTAVESKSNRTMSSVPERSQTTTPTSTRRALARCYGDLKTNIKTRQIYTGDNSRLHCDRRRVARCVARRWAHKDCACGAPRWDTVCHVSAKVACPRARSY